MGFFKPAGDAGDPGDDPVAGDEGSPEGVEAVGDVDEAWVGEHYSCSTEPIPNPLQFMATLIYQTKGIEREQAVLIANRIIANPDVALDTLTREELGIDPDRIAVTGSSAGGGLDGDRTAHDVDDPAADGEDLFPRGLIGFGDVDLAPGFGRMGRESL